MCTYRLCGAAWGHPALVAPGKKQKGEEKKEKKGIKRENKNKEKLRMCVSGCS